MTIAERLLVLLLRAVGIASMLAVVPTFMPRMYMARIHERLGLGPFPEGPIVEYLARSTSMFYAAMGVVLLVLSGDVQRRSGAAALAGGLMAACGAVLLIIDVRAGMPWWWAAAEGPFVLLLGAAAFLLARQIRSPAAP